MTTQTSADRFPQADIPLPRLRTISHLWSCAAVLAGAGVAALALDVPLARWVQLGHCPGFVQKLCSLSEIFGHGLGIAGIVAAIAVLDPWHRYAIPRILAASLGSGLLADSLKLLIGRVRPHHFDFQGNGLDTFGNWFPLLGNASYQQGFPSSHVATAAGLAIVLAYLYPRGRWFFPALVVLAGMQRMLEQAHFLSDIFWGAAVGCIFAPMCVYGSRLARMFDRLEARLLAHVGAFSGTRRRRAAASLRPSKTPTDVPRAA